DRRGADGKLHAHPRAKHRRDRRASPAGEILRRIAHRVSPQCAALQRPDVSADRPDYALLFQQGVVMADELNGKKIAILVANGFEQVEMTGPREALDEAGAGTDLVSPVDGKVQGMQHDEKG